MPIILDGTTGITTPGITNTGTFVFQGPIQVPAGSAATASITTAAGANTGIFFPSSSSVAITTAGTQRFVVSAAGNVGIGTATPTTVLNYTFATINGSTGAGISLFNSNSDAAWIYATSAGLSISTETASPILFKINAATRATLDASGNLGIGTTSPGSRLEVSGVGTFTAGTQETWGSSGLTFGASRLMRQMENTSTAREYICGPDTSTYGTYEFYTARSNGSPTLAYAVSAAGNVGIGTSSPGQRLEVAGNIFVNTSGNPYMEVKTSGAGNNPYLRLTADTNNWTIQGTFSNANDELFFMNNSNTRMAITSGGDVGIGTTNPIYRLSVESTGQPMFSINSTNADGGYLGIFGSGLAIGYIGSAKALVTSSSLTDLAIRAENNLIFSVNTFTERARITSGGDLLVGTTTGSFSRIVKSLSGNYAFQVVNTNATNPYGMEVNMSGVTGGAGQAFFVCYDNANRLVIYGNGDVKNVNNSYGSLSDIKLKQDVVDAASQWNDVKSLRVRKYRFKENPNAALQIGLVAQELEQVSPGLVDESPDRDSEGNYLGTTTKAIKYSVLYMKAIKALQEAMARIEVLEADMAVLKGSN